MSELSDFLKLIAEGKKTDPVAIKAKEHREHIQEVVKEDLGSLFAELAALKKKPVVDKVLVIEPEPIVEEVPLPVIPTPEVKAKTIVSDVDRYLTNKSFQQPDPDKVDPNIKAIQDKMKFLEQAIGRIAATGPGGGEVNLRWLDDIDRGTIADGLYLRYDAPTKKFRFDRGHYDNFYGAFQSTVTQTCGASTATALTYNQVDFSYGVTVANNSQVVLEHPGLYNAQFSVQLTNSGTAIDLVYIWLRQNGVDVVGSAGKIDVPSKHGNDNGALLIGWNFYINTVAANEYFEFMWFTPDETHVTIPTLPAQIAVNATSPDIPSTASVVLTVSPVKIN